MRASCILLLACLAGAASAKQVTLSPPTVVSSPPPPSPPAVAVPTFLTPGVVFSVVVPGSTSLTASLQATFCTQITTAFQGPKFNSTCTISGVTAFNGTSAIVNGFASSVWASTPSVTDLQVATSLRDSLVSTLSTNTSSILTGFSGAAANCACNGVSTVTTLSTETATLTNVTNPGPVQCSAKLTFSTASSVTDQVGIDDGTGIPANRGKYCSTPAVAGGVVGVPGTLTCRQYGVIASNAGTAQALAGTVTLSGGTVSTIATGTAGTGYTSAPTVTISAPSQIPVQIAVTVSSAGTPTATVTPSDNGPYAGTSVKASALSGGPCIEAACTGAVFTIVGLSTANTGPLCTLADFNALTTDVVSVTTSTGAAALGTFPAWTCTPGAPPVITLRTNTLQSAVTATAVASVTDGAVTSITVVNPGSGYVTGTANLPTVTISAPSADNVGKLCSLNPITLDPTIAVNSAIAAGVTTTGQCQPIGRDTSKSVICSIPSAPGGVWAPLNAGTCNVVSTFIPQPGSSVSSTCGVLPQSFTTSVVGPPPGPASPPTASPPTASPPTTSPATYRGRFQIGSVACKGKFLAASANCGDRSVLLRTVSQSKGSRSFWAIDGTAGIATGVTSVVRIGSCNGRANLASAQSTPTPVIGGPSWKVKLTPVDASKPTVVVIEATDKTYKGKFLQVGDKCDDQRGFVWAAKSSSTGQQWELTPLANVN